MVLLLGQYKREYFKNETGDFDGRPGNKRMIFEFDEDEFVFEEKERRVYIFFIFFSEWRE